MVEQNKLLHECHAWSGIWIDALPLCHGSIFYGAFFGLSDLSLYRDRTVRGRNCHVVDVRWDDHAGLWQSLCEQKEHVAH